jgi:hypothetical protein
MWVENMISIKTARKFVFFHDSTMNRLISVKDLPIICSLQYLVHLTL